MLPFKKTAHAAWGAKTDVQVTMQASALSPPPPQLFSRRNSKGGPFIITQNDSLYHGKSAGSKSSGQRHHARWLSLDLPSTISIHPRRRRRRALAAGLLIFLFALLRCVLRLNAKQSSTQGELQPTSHTFHPNGLLLVTPGGRHPINVLIDKAEQRWESLLDTQSKTLEEAAGEYKRRYRRNPPLGFDSWWAFAQQNKVILVDEYDQIFRDFQPFYALQPHDLKHRNKVMEEREHTFTLSFTNGSVTRHGPHAENKRAKDMVRLVEKFAKFVPGQVNLTFIIDDNPAVMIGFNHKERLLELSTLGEFWGPGEFVDPENHNVSNFGKACSPNSPLRKAEAGSNVAYSDFAVNARSFIHDHNPAIDICLHPEFLKLHGSTTHGGMALTPLVPLFSWAKTNVHNDILVTPLEQYDDNYLVYDPPFEYKMKDKLLWRGSTTGSEYRTGYHWEQSQRARLHFLAAEKDGKKEVMWSDNDEIRLQNMTNKAANAAYMDVHFSGEPIQCDHETCEKIKQVIDFAPIMGLEQQNQYKYHMDVDGNGWSGRFHRLLSSNGVVLKSTVFPEWYQDRIIPWVHYVPVKIDYSDLYDIMAFFIGNGEGKGNHDKEAKRIGERGKEFASQHWRKADMASYMFRIVLEFARLLHQEDGENVDYFV